jgi:hypothetical protein
VLCLAIFCLDQTALFSQDILRQITTDTFQKSVEVNNVATKANRAMIEKQTQDFLKAPKFKKVILPLVFHIIAKPGETAPDMKQVQSQIDALNRDFDKKSYKSKHKADSLEKFVDKVTDPEIQFCLAQQDPSGKATTGINFITSSSNNWGMSQDIKLSNKGGMSPWNPALYINVWVANLGSTTSGYAQMPGGPSETDGIVIDFQFFGMNGTAKAPFNLGKTLTHLVGNYLNLYDLWGPCYCCDDGVGDTPIHNAPNYGKTDTYKHVSLCFGNFVEQSMNFMDNTDDDWMYMFTTGQKLRMQSVLSDKGARLGLVNNNTSCSKKLGDLQARAQENTSFNLYPNPGHGTVTLEINTNKPNDVHIEVFDAVGRQMLSLKTSLLDGKNIHQLNTQFWPSGLYVVKVGSSQLLSEQKLLIQ